MQYFMADVSSEGVHSKIEKVQDQVPFLPDICSVVQIWTIVWMI